MISVNLGEGIATFIAIEVLGWITSNLSVSRLVIPEPVPPDIEQLKIKPPKLSHA